MFRTALASSALIGALVAAPALAASPAYTRVLPEAAVTFTAKQMGVSVSGHFKSVQAEVDFRPQDLKASHVAVTVQTASIDAGSGQTNALLTGADWLDAKADPQARFTGTGFTPDGPNRYLVKGTFTAKHHSAPLQVVVTTKPQGADLAMDADFNLPRLAYGLGTGSWADTSAIAADIAVHVHLVVAPAP